MESPQPRSYGPLLHSLRAPSPTPRRAFSLPAMRAYLPSLSSTAHILPLSSLSRPGSPGAPGSRTAKRLSYTLRSRASHHKVRLIIGSLLLTALFLFVNSSTRSHPATRRLRARGAQTVFGTHGSPNGVSLMDIDDTDEWLAEDDLFYSQYTEDAPLSAEDAAAEAEMASRKADVVEQNRQQSLRALTWWLAEGGEIPEDWEVPSKAYLKKVGGRGVERLLEDIEDPELGDEPMFEEGWADFAKKRYRTIVFSKLQDLLLHLTGRRTVPNILLDFVSIGGSDDLTLMHSEGGLRRQFQEMGVLPGRKNMFKPIKDYAAPIPEKVADVEVNAGLDGVRVTDDAVTGVDSPAKIGLGQAGSETSDPDDGDDEDDLVLAPGMDAARIRAAVQAAHGDAYLSDGEDDDSGSSEEYAKHPPPADTIPMVNEPPFDSLDAEELDRPGRLDDSELGITDEPLDLEGEEDDEWEDEDEEDDEEVAGVADRANAELQAAKAKAEALAEQARVKAEQAKAELEAVLKKQADAAALLAKGKARGNAKGRAKPKVQPKANPAVDLPVKKADSPIKPIPVPIQPKPIAIPARAPVKPAAVIPPPPAKPEKVFNEIHPPPGRKVDTLLDRTNANALQKKKAAVQAAKEKARAAKARAGAGEKKAAPAPVGKKPAPPAGNAPIVKQPIAQNQKAQVVPPAGKGKLGGAAEKKAVLDKAAPGKEAVQKKEVKAPVAKKAGVEKVKPKARAGAGGVGAKVKKVAGGVKRKGRVL